MVEETLKVVRKSLVLGQSTISLDRLRVGTGSQEVHLTPTECTLLEHLASHLNQTVPNAELVQTIWGADASKGVHSLRVFIKNLRQKIEPFPEKPQYLVTEPRIGYRLQVSESNL